MGKMVRLYSTLSFTGALAYTAGDEISTNVTAASTQRHSFDFTGLDFGRIIGLGYAINSATFVVTANDQEIVLFSSTDAPAAVGDNVTNPYSAVVRSTALAEFRFDDGAWVNQLGAVATGSSGFQYALAQGSVGLATPTLQAAAPQGRAYNLAGKSKTVIAVVRALAAWDPTDEAYTSVLALDVES